MLQRDRQILRQIVNDNFTFADLSPRFKNVDSTTGNIFCPFHENHDTPAAKMYWDDYRELWVLHCFGECHRNFTAFDYVDLILCLKYQKYKDVKDFLLKNMPRSKFIEQVKLIKKVGIEEVQDNFYDKISYIDNMYAETENTIDYIELLYTR